MWTRRKFLTNSLVAIGSLGAMPKLAFGSVLTSGRFVHDAALNATFPEGCSLRVIARSDQKVAGTHHVWHKRPDGGATFATPDGGWIYVSNCESSDHEGGVGALRFSKAGTLFDAYPILESTTRNCAGGKTPWGTWLSCEENGEEGQVYECDPTGQKPGIVRPAMGSCNHEAAAVDPETSQVYMTEDVRDGCLYRFSPEVAGNLERGTLEVAVPAGTRLEWEALSDPSARTKPLREQVPHAARFQGGEGIVYGLRQVFFTTKKDDRVWSYHLDTGELKTLYDAETSSNPILTGVDNIEISPNGELLVAEDGGDMQIVILDTEYTPMPLVTLHEQEDSEITGPAFSPDGSRLYFSSQRGPNGENDGGRTYELRIPVEAEG